MNRNNLIPTVVVDKNNKTTTVHKRNGLPAPSSSKLGSLRPTLKSAPVQVVSKVGFSTKKNGATRVHISHGRFLDRCGLGKEAEALLIGFDGDGSVEVPDDTLYEYLRLGIKPAEAAILYQLSDGNLDALKESPEFAAALPGDLATVRVWGGTEKKDNEISGVVDFLAEAGIKPTKIGAVLANNLNDSRLKNNVLSPEQLADLFSRFTYSVSTNEDKGTNASRLMDAVMDGRLPFGLVEKSNDITRPNASLAVDALYPTTRKHRAYMTEEQRQEFLDDPDLIVSAARVSTAHKIHWEDSFITSAKSVREFGLEASLEYNPKIMMRQHLDGTYLGPEGAKSVREVMEFIQGEINKETQGPSRPYILSDGDSPTLHIPQLDRTVQISPEDVSDMMRQGTTKEVITDYVYYKGLNSREAFAVSSGLTIASVAEGWL